MKRSLALLPLLLLTLALPALASRNTGGTYALPYANVQNGTVISTTWANGTLADVKVALTDSLSRSGWGGMLAHLQLYAGTRPIPGLTFTDDPDSGLYLNADADVRMSVASTDIMKWTASAATATQPLMCEKGTTVTNSTTNGAGTTSTGNGTGAGVVGTGGATGPGVSGTGGASGGVGVTGTGTSGNAGVAGTGQGAGAGVTGTGGATGAGVTGAGGGTSGVGVAGTGTGASAGVTGTGGGTSGIGVQGTGGATNGIGVKGIGTGSGVGVAGTGTTTADGITGTGKRGGSFVGTVNEGLRADGAAGQPGAIFAPGTSATGGTRQNAIQLVGGDINFFSPTAPTSTTAVSNTLTAMNIPKSWARISTGASPSVVAGFNVASIAAGASNCLRVTLASGCTSTTAFAISLTSDDTSAGVPTVVYSTAQSASTFDICGRKASDGTPRDFQTVAATVHMIAFCAQ